MLRVETLEQRGVRRWRWALAVVLLLLVLGLSGLLAAVSVRQVAASGGSIFIDLGGSSNFINPLVASSDTDTAVTALVFRGLLASTATGSLTGDLASRWTVGRGGRRYTFFLRPGMSWQNGNPVTSYDVAYTYRLLESQAFPAHSGVWSGVRVSTPNAATVVLSLPHANYTFLDEATVGIVPYQFGHSRWPLGSGDFRVVSVHYPAVQLSDDLPGAGLLSRIRFRLGPSLESSVALRCRTHIGPLLGSVNVPSTRLVGLSFNLQRLPYQAVRRALIAAVSTGLASPISSPTPVWPSGSRVPALSGLRHPLRIMRRAGWRLRHGHWFRAGRGVPISFVAPQGANTMPLVNRVLHLWRNDGFAVSFSRMAFPTLVRTALYPGRFDAALVEWDFGGTDYAPGVYWDSKSALNFARLHDREVDDLSGRVLRTPGFAARNRLRSRIGDRLLDLGAAVGLAQEYYVCSVSPKLHGYHAPRLVTDAGGLMIGEDKWYVESKLVLRNPF